MLLSDRRAMDADYRIRNKFATESAISLDVITNYFAKRDGGDVGRRDLDDRSAEQIIAEYNDSIREDEWESDVASSGIYQSGSILYTAKSRARLEVAKSFVEHGLQPVSKHARKNMPNDEIRLIRKEIGESVLSKKEKKKMRKQYKDYNAKREKQAASDRELGMALTRNKMAVNNSLRLDDLIARRK
jgi:hypothetical protein